LKTTVLNAAILTLLSSSTLYALGLGDMKVHSYLNQPFHGEIELIDVKGISLSSIKAGLASVEDYEHVGIEQGYTVNLLRFSVGKNKQGKPVIILKSAERITDPYIQLLIDLAWPDGQLYREYNILLDPPGYQLGSSTVYGGRVTTRHDAPSAQKHSGVADRAITSQVVRSFDKTEQTREQSTYGPVKADENIWQIAQRYKTEHVNLQQLVLAIVGMTPNAFEKGNLNGLKTGAKLTIPSTETVQKIPPVLAKQEVKAHDEAWKDKSEILHVLMPPYFTGKKEEFNKLETTATTPAVAGPSEIAEKPVAPEAPDVAQREPETRGLMASVMSATSLFIPEDEQTDKKAASKIAPSPVPKVVKQASDADLKTKAEISIATSAVESVKDANVILNEQLKLLQQQNKQLQSHLQRSEADLADLRAKIDLLLKERQSVSSQAYAAKDGKEEPWSVWPLWLLFLLIAGGGGFLFWYFYRRPTPEDQGPGPILSSSSDLTDDKSKEKAAEVQKMEEQNAVAEISSDDETSKDIIKPSDEKNAADKITDKTAMAIAAQPKKEGAEKPTASETEDAIDTSTPEEVSAPVSTLAYESEKTSASKEDIEKNITNHITKEIEDDFEIEAQEKSKENAIKDEMQDVEIVTDKRKETDIEAENLIGKDQVNEDLNPSFEKPLETDKNLSKDYGQEKEYKRPLSSLSELEIDEIEPIERSFESVEDTELPEIDINELENYTLEPDTKEEGTDPVPAEDRDLQIDFETDEQAVEQQPKEEKPSEEKPKEESQDEFVLDFEPGLYQPEKETKPEEEPEEGVSEDSEHSLDFVLDEDKAETEPEKNENLAKESSNEHKDHQKAEIDQLKAEAEQTDSLANPLKSKAALDTLLALAKTYIGMDDIEAARQSLQEVAENGDEDQKTEAQALLKELDKN